MDNWLGIILVFIRCLYVNYFLRYGPKCIFTFSSTLTLGLDLWNRNLNVFLIYILTYANSRTTFPSMLKNLVSLSGTCPVQFTVQVYFGANHKLLTCLDLEL